MVRSARGIGAIYAIAAGRPTLCTNVRTIQADLRAWLAAGAQGHDLDAAARRISAYVRAHPRRVVLEPAEDAR